MTSMAASVLMGTVKPSHAGVLDFMSDAVSAVKTATITQASIATTAGKSWVGMTTAAFKITKGFCTLDAHTMKEGASDWFGNARAATSTVRDTVVNVTQSYDDFAAKHKTFDKAARTAVVGSVLWAGGVMPAIMLYTTAKDMSAGEMMSRKVPQTAFNTATSKLIEYGISTLLPGYSSLVTFPIKLVVSMMVNTKLNAAVGGKLLDAVDASQMKSRGSAVEKQGENFNRFLQSYRQNVTLAAGD